MRIIMFLWGIAIAGLGGYATYKLVDVLFIQGKINDMPTFLLVACLLGLLAGITALYVGYKLITTKRGTKQ